MDCVPLGLTANVKQISLRMLSAILCSEASVVQGIYCLPQENKKETPET